MSIIMGINVPRYGNERCEIAIRDEEANQFRRVPNVPPHASVAELCDIAVRVAVSENVSVVVIDDVALGASMIDRLRGLLPDAVTIVPVRYYTKALALTFWQQV